ncbi:MAG: hypothetical protein ACLFQV_12235 [Vulcanimicrobiota bacterium]
MTILKMISRKIKICFLLAALFVFFATQIAPAKVIYKDDLYKLSLQGYGMALWSFLSGGPGNDYTLNTNRLRLETKTFYKDRLSLHLTYDLEVFTGNLVSSPFWNQLMSYRDSNYWDTSYGTHISDAVFLNHNLYRAYVNWEPRFGSLTVGKQRVDWGVMRYWRPTDIFNPESPLQIDAGERPGVDAIYFKPQFSFTSSMDTIYAPSHNRNMDSIAGKYNFLMGDYDCSVLAGKVRNHNVAGFTFDGYIGDGGLRGEVIRIEPPFQPAYYQWAIGSDYSFPNMLTLTGEYFYNGGAGQAPADLFTPSPGFLQTRQKQLVSLGANYQLTPLITSTLFTTYDIEGKSVAISPSIQYNYSQNADLTLGATIMGGKSGGEFSPDINPNVIYMQTKIYF